VSTHKLKTWPVYFDAIWDGLKSFEVRKDDRNFKEGDILFLEEYDPERDEYSGCKIVAEIVYKMTGGKFGLQEGFCVLGINPLAREGSRE